MMNIGDVVSFRIVMSETYSIERDLKEAEAMAKALAYYVRQETLYGKVGSGGMFAGGNMPSLTVGALLLRLRRLSELTRSLDSSQTVRLRKTIHRNEQVLQEWRSHYEQKMLREANSRLDAMQAFFEECERSPEFGAQVYKPEVLRRTIVQELFIVIEERRLDNTDLAKKIQTIDNRLRRYVKRSEFIWAEILQPIYPESTFWWLYQRPPLPVGKRK